MTKLLLLAASAAAFSSKVVSPDAVALRKQAQQLRDEAAKEEKELLALQGRNNILPVDTGLLEAKASTPKWCTQIWAGGEERPALRTSWLLLADGEAHVDCAAASDADGHEPGWRLKERDQLIECWFWLAADDDASPTKYTLTTSATSEAEVDRLLAFEKDARERRDAAKARLDKARERGQEDLNPFQRAFALQEHVAAVDGYEVAERVFAEYEHYAERCKGATVALGDVRMTLGARGHAAIGRDDGTFAAWESTR